MATQEELKRIAAQKAVEFVPEDEYEKQLIQDGDDVLVLHLMAGG